MSENKIVPTDFADILSLNGNLWRFAAYDENTATLLAEKFDLPPAAAVILAARGIGVDEAEDFLNPGFGKLMPDPSVLKDMDKAAARIADAVENRERVAVIGDYDVDGATSSSLLKLFLQDVGLNVPVHIPEREEGYGPSFAAVDEFLKNGAELLVTTDCGTTAFEVLEYAQNKGMDVIVLDHHEAEAKLPAVYAVVNPKRLDECDNCPYLKYLAAVGVVFMTVVAVNRELRRRGFYSASRPEPNLKNRLDLVALGTVCDVVPLLGLNRAFVRFGVNMMAQRKNPGICALADKAGLTEAPGVYQLGYVLGPRINAGGRVGEAATGYRLLCSENKAQAEQLAEKLNVFNEKRKEIENYVLLQAMELLESVPQSYPMAFVYGRDWHQGVIGIVAGKLKERYNLPSFVMSIETDEVKGSARSVAGLNIGALIMAAKEKGLLTKGGGHNMAAGFSLKEENLEAFRRFAGEYVMHMTGSKAPVPVTELEAVVSVAALTPEFADATERLAPFGAGNPEPKLMLANTALLRADIVGNGHIRCTFGSFAGDRVKAMAFNAADSEMGKALLAGRGQLFHLAGSVHTDKWMGNKQICFFVDDAMHA